MKIWDLGFMLRHKRAHVPHIRTQNLGNLGTKTINGVTH